MDPHHKTRNTNRFSGMTIYKNCTGHSVHLDMQKKNKTENPQFRSISSILHTFSESCQHDLEPVPGIIDVAPEGH